MLHHLISLVLAIPSIPAEKFCPSFAASADECINAAIQAAPGGYFAQFSGQYDFTLGAQLIDLTAPTYDLETSILVDRPHITIRCAPGTMIRILRGTVPAIIDHGGVTIEGCYILARIPFGTVPKTVMVPGIDSTAPTRIRDVTIFGFTHDGLHIIADAHSFGTNANQWQARDSVFINNTGAGIYVRGGDVGQGTAESNLSNHNCLAPDGLARRNPDGQYQVELRDASKCAGFVDESFLGNQWIADMSQQSKLGYLSTNGNARSDFIGCYSEGDELCAILADKALWIGGICGSGTKLVATNYLWDGGRFQARYPSIGSYLTPVSVVPIAPTSTIGHAIGERFLALQPTPGSCAEWMVARVAGTVNRGVLKCVSYVDK